VLLGDMLLSSSSLCWKTGTGGDEERLRMVSLTSWNTVSENDIDTDTFRCGFSTKHSLKLFSKSKREDSGSSS